jgi:hypothetical protein
MKRNLKTRAKRALGPEIFKFQNENENENGGDNTTAAAPPIISRCVSFFAISSPTSMAASMNRNSRLRCLVSLMLSLLQVAASTHATAACFVTTNYYQTTNSKTTRLFVSSGFSFQDGEQVLVSVQKPLGIVLEEQQPQPQPQPDDSDDDDDETAGTVIFVAEMDPAGSASRAGVLTGDVLLAVQNASVENRSLEYVMAFLAQAPRVVNLRFLRQTTRQTGLIKK